ncbi:hypothetical protein ACU62P_14625 [Klebsiella aerogenes]
MTITLQAVNELIQSLESAGELSIKERKYFDLAKAYADKEAESVAQALTFEKCRELSGCPADVDLQDWVKQLAAENVALKRFVSGSCYVFDGDHDDDMPDEFVDASNYLPLTPLTDSYLFKVWTLDTPPEILEIIDSGDLETICYESERSYAEDFRLALYNFRQMREGADK